MEEFGIFIPRFKLLDLSPRLSFKMKLLIEGCNCAIKRVEIKSYKSMMFWEASLSSRSESLVMAALMGNDH